MKMTLQDRIINAVEQAYEAHGYNSTRLGLRGTNDWEQANYSIGCFLPCSIDDPEGRGIEFDPSLDRLPGSSCFSLRGAESVSWDEDKYADALLAVYRKALKYSDCDKVILIVGNKETEGADDYETVIGCDWHDNQAIYFADI